MTSSDINPLLIPGKCLNDCEVTLTVGEENTQLYVCMEQVGRLSEYFRIMFFGDFKEKNQKQFQIQDETPDDMICFFNAIDPDPIVRTISEYSIQVLMRLSDKFQCNLLKARLKTYIEVNEPSCESVTTILNWLICSLKYNMPKDTIKICLPGVACLSLSALSVNQEKIGLNLFGKLLEAKMKSMMREMDICSKKLRVGTAMSCGHCHAMDHLPYKIYWCAAEEVCRISEIDVLCWHCCMKINTKSRHSLEPYRCCREMIFYFKCRSCQVDPAHYQNKNQCLCARKNYQILLKNVY